MIFKKGKYNIVFMLMFVIVIGVFAFEVFLSSSPSQIVIPNDQPNAEDPNKPNDDLNLPEIPDDSNDVFDNSVRDPNMPSTKFPLKIVNYSLDKLYSSEGFKSKFDRKMTNIANVFGGVKAIQNINGNIEVSDGVSLEAMTFKSENAMGYGADYKRYFYNDGSNVIKYQTATPDADITTAKVTQMTKKEYKDTFGMALTEKPVFNFSDSNFKASLVTKQDRNKRNYYEITVTSKNTSMFTNEYYRYFESSGDLKNAQGVSVTYIISVYLSGNIFKIQSQENLTGKNPATGAGVNTTIETTQTFTIYSSSFNIAKPF